MRLIPTKIRYSVLVNFSKYMKNTSIHVNCLNFTNICCRHYAILWHLLICKSSPLGSLHEHLCVSVYILEFLLPDRSFWGPNADCHVDCKELTSFSYHYTKYRQCCTRSRPLFDKIFPWKFCVGCFCIISLISFIPVTILPDCKNNTLFILSVAFSTSNIA